MPETDELTKAQDAATAAVRARALAGEIDPGDYEKALKQAQDFAALEHDVASLTDEQKAIAAQQGMSEFDYARARRRLEAAQQ